MPTEVSEGTSTRLPQTVPPPPVPAGSATLSPDESVTHRCANCLTPLAGPFCAQCGQHVADYHRSVWRFVADFFDNTLCWDNKIFRTLGPLMKRPGWLTQEFMAGRRVRYVHPLRLFLFTSAICLTLMQYTHRAAPARDRANQKTNAQHNTATRSDDDADDEKDSAASPAPVASLAPTPTASPASGPAVAPASPAPASGPTPAVPTLSQVFQDTFKPGSQDRKPLEAAEAEKLGKQWETIGNDLQKKIATAQGAGAFGQKMTANLQQKASYVALAMLPIFAWLMYFAYGRRGGYFFAYLVFSLHYHTFLLLFWTVYLWLGAIVKATHLSLFEVPLMLGFLGPPWYLYVSLQRFYGESRARTAAKTFAVGGLHLLAIIIGVGIAGVGSSLSLK